METGKTTDKPLRKQTHRPETVATPGERAVSNARALLLENEQEYRIARQLRAPREVLEEYRQFSRELMEIIRREGGER